jgi:hypothetical protein
MKTDRQLIERFLEMQEHAEQVTDEQFLLWQADKSERQQTLDDPQMRELVEQMVFAKRAFKNVELQTEEPDVEGEWEKFAAEHAEELEALTPKAAANFSLFTLHSSLRKLAASFIAVLLVSGMAFAAIHIVRMVNYQKAETVQVEQSTSYKPSTALPVDTVKTDTTGTAEPVVFDNVPLEKMLTEIAAYYHAEVLYQNDDARQLRFHFVWKREDGLGHAIEKLNRFESLSVRLDEGDGEYPSTKIIVE